MGLRHFKCVVPIVRSRRSGLNLLVVCTMSNANAGTPLCGVVACRRRSNGTEPLSYDSHRLLYSRDVAAADDDDDSWRKTG